MFLYARTIVFMIALWAGGLLLYHLRNDKSNEFCTTYAYGWPFPWRIDYCECEGDKTVYPIDSVVWNVGLTVACAFGASQLVPRRS